MTTLPVQAADAANAMAALERVWGWLAAAAGESVDWRAYVNSSVGTPAHSVLVVVWDATARTCPRCGLSHRRPCPVHLDPDGTTLAATAARHDCGADLAPALHATYRLTDLATRSDVEAAVATVERRRPDNSSPPARSA